MVKFGCGEPGWHWRNTLAKAGIEPTAVYFKNGVKIAEQYRLSKKTWADIWRASDVPKHQYDVAYGEGSVLGDD